MAGAAAMPASMEEALQLQSVTQFLLQQSREFFTKGLFNCPCSCLAIFRLLPRLAQHIVMRLLFVTSGGVSQDTVRGWTADPQSRETALAFEALFMQFHLLILRVDDGDCVELHATFQTVFQGVIAGGAGDSGVAWITMPAPPDAPTLPAEELARSGRARWDNVLHFLVDPKVKNAPSKVVQETLLAAKLRSKAGEITRAGFQFALQTQFDQLWFYLLSHIRELEGPALVEAVSLTFRISFGRVGKPYALQSLSPMQQDLLRRLQHVGLVSFDRRETLFYSTPLAASLMNEAALAAEETEKFVMVETNFRVYAYDASELKVSLLALFVDMVYQLPHLTVGVLTRDSMKRALQHGITAAQVVHFLQVHAHPEMYKNQSCEFFPLPRTVGDQLHLWERERSRLRCSDGVMYSRFPTWLDYDHVKKHAESLGAVVWCDDQLLRLLVTADSHPEVRAFWKRRKQELEEKLQVVE